MQAVTTRPILSEMQQSRFAKDYSQSGLRTTSWDLVVPCSDPGNSYEFSHLRKVMKWKGYGEWEHWPAESGDISRAMTMAVLFFRLDSRAHP